MNNAQTVNSAQPALFRGERLRELREAQGLDVESLAKRLALSPAQLRQLESNQSSLFYSNAIRLAAARKVSEFLGETLVLEPSLAPAASLAVESDGESESGQVRARASEPPIRRLVVREPRFALSGWSAALWGVAMTFAVLLGSQVFNESKGFSLSAVSSAKASAFLPSSGSGLMEPSAPAAAVVQADPVAPVVMPIAATSAELAAVSTVAVVQSPLPALVKPVDNSPACGMSDGPEATFTPAKATKDAAQIFVQGSPGQVVCVKDSRGQVWRHEFASSTGRSFSGMAPWLVESAQLIDLQVYFQGTRARPSTLGATRMRLIAAEPT